MRRRVRLPSREQGKPHAQFGRHQLSSGQPLCARHRGPLCGAGAVFVSRRNEAQHARVRLPDPDRAVALHPLARPQFDQPAGSRRAAFEAVELRSARCRLRDRTERPHIVQLRPRRRASDHHLGDSQPAAVLGGAGGARPLGRPDSDLAPGVLWLLRRRVPRGHGGGLEPVDGRRSAVAAHAGRELCQWGLGLRDPGSDLHGARGHAGRQMVRRVRRGRGDRFELPVRQRPARFLRPCSSSTGGGSWRSTGRLWRSCS